MFFIPRFIRIQRHNRLLPDPPRLPYRSGVRLGKSGPSFGSLLTYLRKPSSMTTGCSGTFRSDPTFFSEPSFPRLSRRISRHHTPPNSYTSATLAPHISSSLAPENAAIQGTHRR